MNPDTARAILTSPLGNLEPDMAADLIVQLLNAARGLGLKVNEAIVPDLWVAALTERSFAELKTALMAYARRGNAWLNIPGELLAQLPDLPNADPDVRVWEAIEREVAARGNCELSHLPGFTVRHYLALIDCGTLAWDLAHADHPLRRQEIRTRFLAACRLPRPEPVALLEAPALPYREALRAHRTREITARAAPLLLPIDE